MVQLLSCSIVMINFLLLLKLRLETGEWIIFCYILTLRLHSLVQLASWHIAIMSLWVVRLDTDQDLIGILYFLISLFHVVVENDEISTQIIRHLNSLKGGRVTFIPLNRVKAPHITYPQSSDVIPLLKKLKFSPNYAAAFSQVSCFSFVLT